MAIPQLQRGSPQGAARIHKPSYNNTKKLPGKNMKSCKRTLADEPEGQ